MTKTSDEHRAEGSGKDLGGKIKEGAGKMTGDREMESEGKMDQAKGKAQKAWGDAKDAVKDK